eukprot:307161_1
MLARVVSVLTVFRLAITYSFMLHKLPHLCSRRVFAARSAVLQTISTRGGGCFDQGNSGVEGETMSSLTKISGIVSGSGEKDVSEKMEMLKPTPLHPKFELVEEKFVSEYNCSAALYVHKKSGAQVMSVQNDEEEKVFGISFRTPIKDSKGLPHVVEHSVLCGSKRYPVKEPFSDLLKGSLQTFLNAFTYNDRTCYPVASLNQKDFNNLIRVYMDAVFFPRAVLDPQVIAQEGWHYELENENDPLIYKGVVYNEMKGVYSSADSRLSRYIQCTIFADHDSYAFDSGGIPDCIPKMTFEDFVNFHKTYYHPRNCRTFYYGDDDVNERLNLLCEFFDDFDTADCSPELSQLGWQSKRPSPWKVTKEFPVSADGPSSEKHMLCVNWLINDRTLSEKEKLALSVLDHLLVGHSSSPLRKALLESGLGTAFIGDGLDDTFQQSTFSVGLKGVDGDKTAEVEALIFKILNDVANAGFDDDAIAASMNSIEFHLREFNTGGSPRGLSLMLGALSSWIYDGNPIEAIEFNASIAELKNDIKRGDGVFEKLLRSVLLENTHRATIEMKPNPNLESVEEMEEIQCLADAKSKMSKEDVTNIIKTTKELKDAQVEPDSPEAKATLPKLTLSDLNPKIKEIDITVKDAEKGATIVTHDISTSGIIYVDIGLDLTSLSLDDIPLINLLSRMFLETGTSELDRVQLSQYIDTHTGGLCISSISGPRSCGDSVVVKPDNFIDYLFIKGKAMSDKAPELFSVMHSVLTDSKLDSQQRAVEMLKESKARMEMSIVSSGHSYASMRIGARLSLGGLIAERTAGVTYLETLKNILEQAENDWPALLERLTRIRDTLLQPGNVIINLTGDKEILSKCELEAKSFIEKFPVTDETSYRAPWGDTMELLAKENEGFVIPTSVQYVGRGGRLYEPGERVSGAALVVSQHLKLQYLWENIRVVGGAYGSMMALDRTNGLLKYISYRDPNLANTLDVYEGAASYLESVELSKEDIEISIIGTIGDLDSPLSPDQKGFVSLHRHLIGVGSTERQRIRDEVLATTREDFRDFGRRLKSFNSKAMTSVIGSKASFEAANEVLPEDSRLSITQLL